jgi:hypothetical protein
MHINNISKKANATLGFLRRNLRNVSETYRKTAYISLVRSTMEYGATIWNPSNLLPIFQVVPNLLAVFGGLLLF